MYKVLGQQLEMVKVSRMRCKMCNNQAGGLQTGSLTWILPRGVQALPEVVSVGFLIWLVQFEQSWRRLVRHP